MPASKKPQTIGYRYYFGIHMGLNRGECDEIVEIQVGDRSAWKGSVTGNASIQIDAPLLFGGDKSEGGIVGQLDVMMGGPTQTVNARLAAMLGGLVPAFRGITSLFFDGQISAMTPYPKAWKVRRRRAIKGWDGAVWYPEKAVISLASGTIKAMNPAHIIYEAWTNRSWGRGLPTSRLDAASFAAAADVFHAEGFGLCLRWTRRDSIKNFLVGVLNHIGAACYPDRHTGLIKLVPIRDDYDPEELPLFTLSNGLLGIDDDDNAAAAAGVNEVIVAYRDPITDKTGRVRLQNSAAIQASGSRITEEHDYPGLPTASLAMRVAQRDLRANSGFLKRFRLRFDRRAYEQEPASVFRISDPSRQIESMVLRAIRIDEAAGTDGTITIRAVQDVFGLPATAYASSQPSGHVPPDFTPAPIEVWRAIEAPYVHLAARQEAGEVAALSDEASFLQLAAARPTTMSLEYQIESRVGASGPYTPQATGDFTPTAVLVDQMPRSHAPIEAALEDGVDLSFVNIGTLAILENEILRVDALDLDAMVATFARGCGDSVPAVHAAGARVWFTGEYIGEDPTEYAEGVDVYARLRTITAAAALPVEDAVSGHLVLAGRQFRPYPPGKVTINGMVYPTTVQGYDPLQITGVHRDRLLQQDQLIDTAQGAIGPEEGTTYTIELRNAANNALVQSQSGLANPTYSFPLDVIGELVNLRARMFSVRDGLQSSQMHSIDVQRVSADGSAWVPGAATAPPADQMIFDGTRWLMQKAVPGPPGQLRLYQSTDGQTFEFTANLVGIGLARDERGMAYSGNLYLSWPSHAAYVYPPPSLASYFVYRTPRLTLSDGPALWAVQHPPALSSSGGILCIAWDAANDRFVVLTSAKELWSTTNGTSWSYEGALVLPTLAGPTEWYQSMLLRLWKEGSTWYLMHEPGGGQYQASTNHLLRSPDLINWTLCAGSSYHSPPPGVTWNGFTGFAAASRGSVVVIVAYAARSGPSPQLKTVVLRATDGATFSIVYEEDVVQARVDYQEVKPVGASGWVASGPNGLLVSDDDGATWSTAAMAVYPTAMRSNGSRVVASRKTKAVTGGYVNEPWYTDNGEDWMLCTVREYRTGAHQHWRLKIQENAGLSADVNIQELVLFDGATALSGYTKTTGSNDASGIDDADTNTYWGVSNADVLGGYAWVAFEFGAPVTVTAAEVTAHTTTGPKRLEIQWSNDGSEWHSGWYEAALTWDVSETKRLEAAS